MTSMASISHQPRPKNFVLSSPTESSSNPNEPRVLSVGTAVPSTVIAQAQARSLTRTLFASGFKDIERLISVFDNGQVMKRHLVAPIEWFATEHSWPEKKALYLEKALKHGEAAVRCAMRCAKLEPEDIDAIIFVSSTGLATPSLDSHLSKRLNLSRNVARLPVWGLSCAGGAVGLSRAADHARSNPGSTVLLVAAELCRLTFPHPGGLKVLKAYAETLGLDQSALEDSYAVLERFMRRWAQLPAEEIGAVSAMGPGFSFEHAFFRT